MLNDLEIQICLISLYGKCSDLEECNRIFDTIKSEENEKYQNELSIWNALMNAYGRNGKSNDCMELFTKMNAETKIHASNKTYCILLNSNSHSGDVAQAKYVWNGIKDEHIKYS